MIITSKEQSNAFRPVEINIIIEDRIEAARWYSIFDLAAVKDVLGYGNAVELRTGITNYYSWETQQQVENEFIKAFYDRYKEQLLELINNVKVG